jgi:hypothetical protein
MAGSTFAYPKITRNLSYLSEVFTRAFRACNSRTGLNAGFWRARGNGQAFALAHATKLDPMAERSFQISVKRIRHISVTLFITF